MHYLEIGGAETALIGLLQTIDYSRYDVDLFLNAHRGEMMQYIPAEVNLLSEITAYSVIEKPMTEALRRGQLGVVAGRMLAKICYYFYACRKHPKDGSAIFGYVGKYVTPFLPSLKRLGEYDLAISFLTPHNVVLDKVRARKKLCWIHTDYTNIDVNSSLELPVWGGYDVIAGVSSNVCDCFCKVFPSLQSKTIVIENILSSSFIRRMADAFPVTLKDGNELVLLTVGRYSYPKKLEDIPAICKLLVDRELNVRWYIIGYGGSDEYIRTAISVNRMEKNVILLGKQTNPYPYIKACDWYVQPSRYEGKSIVAREAQILCKPVIITNYPTAKSQVQSGIDGVIVPMSVAECADSMFATLSDEALKSRITDYLSTHDYGNESEVEKIYKLVNE
jgi:glycosyltransferase involved in cell wall biosynthesis